MTRRGNSFAKWSSSPVSCVSACEPEKTHSTFCTGRWQNMLTCSSTVVSHVQRQGKSGTWDPQNSIFEHCKILLMDKILHLLIGSFSHYLLHGFIHPRWCRISSINGRKLNFDEFRMFGDLEGSALSLVLTSLGFQAFPEFLSSSGCARQSSVVKPAATRRNGIVIRVIRATRL